MVKLPQIQIARAIAALAVTYFHSYIALRGYSETRIHPLPFLAQWGFLGVGFFFAISGYIIAMVVDRPRFSPGSFLIKRFFRIYPLYWIFILAALYITTYPRWHIGAQERDLAFLVQNFLIWPLPNEPIYAVGWSLEHEVIFYAIAALVVPFAGINGLLLTMAALAIGGIFIPHGWDYHLLSGPQVEFALGIAIHRFRSHLRVGFMVPFSISALSYALVDMQISYGGTFAASSMLLAMLNLPEKLCETRLRWLIKIGDASFSLYLLHWIAFAVASYPTSMFRSWTAEPYRFAVIAGCVLIAMAFYRWVEKPLIDLGHFSARQTASSLT